MGWRKKKELSALSAPSFVAFIVQIPARVLDA